MLLKTLEVVDFSFHHTRPCPQSPAQTFKGCLLTGNGEEGSPWIGGWGRTRRAYEQGLLSTKGALSGGSWCTHLGYCVSVRVIGGCIWLL